MHEPPTRSLVGHVAASLEYRWNNATSGPVPLLRRTLDALSSPVIVRSRTSSGSLSVTYAGLRDGVRYGLTHIEQQYAKISGEPVHRTVRRSSWQEVDELLRRRARDTDLLVVGAPRRWLRPRRSLHDLVAPMRIHYLVELDQSTEPIRNRISRRPLERLRKGERERRWTLEACSDDSSFWDFYERMHLPTMRLRHGEHARTESARVAYHCLFRRGLIFFVREGERRVAGALCRIEEDEKKITMRLIGVLDGDEEHYQSNVYVALYALTLEWAQHRGFRSMDLSGSEPFVSKGTYQFKRLFDPTILIPGTHYRDKRLCLVPLASSRIFREFLRRNPLICEASNGELEAVFFEDEDGSARGKIGWTTANIRNHRIVHVEPSPLRVGPNPAHDAGTHGDSRKEGDD